MLNSCDDNAFVLCVMAFMMIEASNLKQIDEAIDDEQRANFKANLAVSTTTLTQNSKANSSENLTNSKANLNAYERLKSAIYERDFTLGECFEKNTAFISFENDELKISSNAANEADRNTLNKGFKLIMQIATQTLGENVKIAVQKSAANAVSSSVNAALNAANSALNVDESKLQDIKKPKNDLKSSFEKLKSGAKKQDKQAETIDALDECFGKPTKQ